jgi:hypothetical protein
MDLAMYTRVLWRFRLIVVCGLLLAIALAFLSFARVSFAGGTKITYREQAQYASYGTLWVAPKSVQSGRASLSSATATPQQQAANLGVTDPLQFSNFAVLYAQLVNSDPVLAAMRRAGCMQSGDEIRAVPVLALQNQGDALPLVSVAGLADSPARAIALARCDVTAFGAYLRNMQNLDRIPKDQRVIVIKSPQTASVWRARTKTRPIVVLLTVLIGTIALCFILENMRPRIRPVADAEATDADAIEPRRRSRGA